MLETKSKKALRSILDEYYGGVVTPRHEPAESNKSPDTHQIADAVGVLEELGLIAALTKKAETQHTYSPK